jgi:hypothetical protein
MSAKTLEGAILMAQVAATREWAPMYVVASSQDERWHVQAGPLSPAARAMLGAAVSPVGTVLRVVRHS